jgi:lysozyme
MMPRDSNAPPAPAEKPKGVNPRFPALVAIVGTAAAAYLVPDVQRYEGRSYDPYRDVIGVWTVCDGDTKDVRPDVRQTDAQCDARLEQQLIAHARPVLQCVPALRPRPHALAASVSLAYNIGPAGFCRSLAARRFNAGDWPGGCDAFRYWNSAGGRVIRGLVNRRAAERAECLKDAK